jgi:hypothetical protein
LAFSTVSADFDPRAKLVAKRHFEIVCDIVGGGQRKFSVDFKVQAKSIGE